MDSSYNFTSDFQDSILACLIRHPDLFYGFGEIIKPEYFTGAASCEVVYHLIDYRKEFGKYPNFTTLGNYAYHKAARINAEHATETLDYVEKLAGVDTGDNAAVLKLSVNFARERAIFDAIRKIHAAQMEGKSGDVNPIALMQSAMAVGTNLDDLGLSLYHDYEKIIRTTTDVTYGVHTGYQAYDKLWKAGWAPGWLIVFLAPPKTFKTAMVINLALNIASVQDVDVLYYACEISQELAAMRAITNVSNWTMEEITAQKEKGILLTGQRMKERLWGNVWFKGYPSKSTTISEIKAHARQVIGTYGLRPKAIVIDYAETVRPDSVDKKASDWRQQADIYTQARALGSELGCAVIMPDRCNRETVGKSVPNMSSFQGAFEKAGIVDAAIGLCATDAERKQNRLRHFVFLNRHGDALKHFDGKIDPERMKITVGAEIEYDPDADEADELKPRRKQKRKVSLGAELTQRD